MLSSKEVLAIERYEATLALEKIDVKHALLEEVENLRKIVAFYQGEALDVYGEHLIEKEYRFLVSKEPSKRSKQEKERIILLVNALSDAVDASDEAYEIGLNKYINK